MRYDYDLTIIGAGSGGISAALFARALGRSVAIIEADKIGGECTHSGCIPSKSLIHYSKSKFYHPDRVFDYIKEKVGIVEQQDRKDLDTSGVVIIPGRARFCNPHTLKVEYQGQITTITSRYILIATGSSPLMPEEYKILNQQFPGKVVTNETIFQLQKLPESVLFIGSGVISLELAQAFRNFGLHVAIYSRTGEILKREDIEVCAAVKAVVQVQGIEIITSEQLPFETLQRFEKVVVATGRKGNSEDLGLETIGVSAQRSYIPVNVRMQTIQKHVYAVGDVVNHFQFTHAARDQAIVAVQNMFVPFSRARFNFNQYAWSIFSQPEIGHFGRTEQELQAQEQPYQKIVQPIGETDRGISDEDTQGFVKILHQNGKILGVHIVAQHASEMLQEYINAVHWNKRLKDLSGPVHPYPTYATITQNLAGRFLLGAYEHNKLVQIITRLKFWL